MKKIGWREGDRDVLSWKFLAESHGDRKISLWDIGAEWKNLAEGQGDGDILASVHKLMEDLTW